jgi:hypothetical protein
MADAIRSVGLEPLYINAKNLQLLVISACAYLRAGIPCLLVGAMIEAIPGMTVRPIGLHAVAVTGFSIPKGPAVPYDSTTATLFAATSIVRLYAHDDQVGPFSRIQINRGAPLPLLTSWEDQNRNRGYVFLESRILLLPLYHKIRVPISSVISTIVALDSWLETARVANLIQVKKRIEWDISLTENPSFKADIYRDKEILTNFRVSTLEDDLPRYIWRVNASSDGSKLFDLLFDATDLLQGGHIARGLPYSKLTCLGIAAIAKNAGVLSYIKQTGNRGLEMAVKWFADNAAAF